MGLPWLAQDTITLWAPTLVDDYGQALADWSNPTQIETIEGCSVQPQAGTEYTVEREAITTRWLVWVPDYHPNLTGTLRVGIPFHQGLLAIDGSTPYFPDPTGLQLDHHFFLLKEVNG